jgi:YggT family protein
MFVVSNLLAAAAQVLNIVFLTLYWLVIVRAIISWVNPDPYNPIVGFLQAVTEPILYPVRKLLPFSLKFGFDLSPIIAIIILRFLQEFLVTTLLDLSFRLR